MSECHSSSSAVDFTSKVGISIQQHRWVADVPLSVVADFLFLLKLFTFSFNSLLFQMPSEVIYHVHAICPIYPLSMRTKFHLPTKVLRLDTSMTLSRERIRQLGRLLLTVKELDSSVTHLKLGYSLKEV